MMEKHLKLEMRDCDLTVRAINVLITNGIITAYDLIQLDSRELLRWRNCGMVTIKEITRLKRILTSIHEDIELLVLGNTPIK